VDVLCGSYRNFLLVVPQFGLCIQINDLELFSVGEFVLHRCDPLKYWELYFYEKKNLARYMHGDRYWRFG